jgi:hypothetical protein
MSTEWSVGASMRGITAGRRSPARQQAGAGPAPDRGPFGTIVDKVSIGVVSDITDIHDMRCSEEPGPAAVANTPYRYDDGEQSASVLVIADYPHEWTPRVVEPLDHHRVAC